MGFPKHRLSIRAVVGRLKQRHRRRKLVKKAGRARCSNDEVSQSSSSTSTVSSTGESPASSNTACPGVGHCQQEQQQQPDTDKPRSSSSVSTAATTSSTAGSTVSSISNTCGCDSLHEAARDVTASRPILVRRMTSGSLRDDHSIRLDQLEATATATTTRATHQPRETIHKNKKPPLSSTLAHQSSNCDTVTTESLEEECTYKLPLGITKSSPESQKVQVCTWFYAMLYCHTFTPCSPITLLHVYQLTNELTRTAIYHHYHYHDYDYDYDRPCWLP